MARTKTQRTSQNTKYTKRRQTLGNNYCLCFSDISVFYSFYFQILTGHPLLNRGNVKQCHVHRLSPVWRVDHVR